MTSAHKSGKARKKGGAKLTTKQEKFARAYVEAGNACEAYRRAYDASRMKPESINRKAQELLSHGMVTARIEELQSKASRLAEDRYEVTQERIVAELARIAFARSEDYFTWGSTGVEVKDSSTLSRDQLAAVAEVSQTISASGGSIKVKLSDKQSALEKLGRIMGMFKERLEHTGKDGSPLTTETTVIVLPSNSRDNVNEQAG
jgi:phage terminase small subunit